MCVYECVEMWLAFDQTPLRIGRRLSVSKKEQFQQNHRLPRITTTISRTRTRTAVIREKEKMRHHNVYTINKYIFLLENCGYNIYISWWNGSYLRWRCHMLNTINAMATKMPQPDTVLMHTNNDNETVRKTCFTIVRSCGICRIYATPLWPRQSICSDGYPGHPGHRSAHHARARMTVVAVTMSTNTQCVCVCACLEEMPRNERE